MIDWKSSMTQTFEYYTVDPETWKDIKRIRTVKSSTLTRDSGVETLGSASIDITESLGECYIRVYLVAIQNGVNYKFPLGTYLVQSPSTKYNGKTTDITLDAYTPLLELKEKLVPIGYYIPENTNIMSTAYMLTRENLRAPVVSGKSDKEVYSNFIANSDENWLVFLNDLILNAKHTFDIDEMGRILFSPIQDTASLQPVWDYDDDNSSILYSDITLDHDIYGIPNVVEVVYSKTTMGLYYSRVVNDDPNSPTSTVNRGREIIHRETNPSITGVPTQQQIDEYANNLLRKLSQVEFTITYTHGYCPVRLGDCVRLNYKKAGIHNVKAKVISQSIKCEPGCPVTEKAVFNNKLWG